jgi:leucyl-tRNA synthetase
MRKNPTPAESYFWNRVRGRQLLGFKFNRQFVIEHANLLGKKYFFIADFHCFDKRLIIELDGGIHQEKIEYDKLRKEVLIEMGYEVLRFKNEDVLKDWNGVAGKIISVLEQR